MTLYSLYDSFKPIFYLSVIFGTMPLYFYDKPLLHLKISKYRVIYSWLLFCFVVGHGVATPWFVVESKSPVVNPVVPVPQVESNVSTYVNFIRNQTSAQIIAMKVIEPLVNTFMCLGSFWVNLMYVTDKLPLFLSHLTDIDRGLIPFMKLKSKLNLYISLTLTIYFIIFTVPVFSFDLYIVYSQGTFWPQAWSTLLLFSNASTYTTEIQFLNWALCLQIRFKVINDFLQRHSTQNEMFNSFINISQKKWSVKERLTIRKIELAHQCNKKLCDLIEDLNEMYQLQLLCSVAGCFINILLNIYFALFASFLNVTNKSSGIQTASTIMWTTFYLVRFLVTTVVSCKTSQEATKTKSLVSSVNRRSFDNVIKEELNLFLQDTSNRTIRFSACGLFTLSTQLITSALAAGTTYLVILIQFRPQIS